MTGKDHIRMAVQALQAAAYHMGQALDLEAEVGSYRTYPHPETRSHLRSVEHGAKDLAEHWGIR